MEMAKNIKISVLIVTYNNIKTIDACLNSIDELAYRGCEILVRDNASPDKTGQHLRNRNGIIFFPADSNIGFGAAVNYLAARAGGEYLFLLNPDCLCPAGFFEKLMKFAAAHDGAISPALEYPSGAPQESARLFPTHGNIIFSRRSPFFYLGLTGASKAGYISPVEAARVPAVSATAILIKRDLFEKVGGFDERFFMYGEDIDLCKRLSDAGIEIWYVPDLKIKHLLGASSEKAALRTAYYHHLSIFKYFTKHFPKAYIKNLVLACMLSMGFVIMALLRLFGLKRRK